MKSFVYILENRKGKRYVGITGLLPELRLLRHNKGDVKSTRYGKPWKIIYIEEYTNYNSARSREKQIKSWHGGNALKKLIDTSAGSSNGRTAAFGAVYLGSNPSPAAVSMKKIGGVK